MPDHESTVRALEIIKMTGIAGFPCIRFFDEKVGYKYGDLYPRADFDCWSVGDPQS